MNLFCLLYTETTRLVATQWTTVILNCPHDVGRSDVPTWSKDGREVQQNQWVYVSPFNKTLAIKHVLPHYSGLYYCDGKPAVYLTVIEAETADRGERQEVREEQRIISQIWIILKNISQF